MSARFGDCGEIHNLSTSERCLPLHRLAHVALGGLAVAHRGLQPGMPEDLPNDPQMGFHPSRPEHV